MEVGPVGFGERFETLVRIGDLAGALRLDGVASLQRAQETSDERFQGREPLVGLPGHGSPEHLVDARGHGGALHVDGGRAIVHRGDRAGAEGQGAGEQLEEQHGERELIARRRSRLSGEDFGRLEPRRRTPGTIVGRRLDE